MATYSQNKENIFYSSDYLQIETQLNPNDFRRTTSGQFSESDIPDSPLPKLSSSSSQNRKNSENNVFLKEGSQNEAKKPLNSQSNKWNDSWNFNRNLSINSEENNNENIRIITKQIMVIGSSQTGKKSLIYSLFGENEDETFSNSENIYK